MKGGYILIDCKGLELTSGSQQTIADIFESVKTAHESGKVCIATNCKWSGEVMSPISVMITKLQNGKYTATASTLQLTISNTNKVSIASLVQ